MTEARFVFLSPEDVVAAGGLDVAATIDVVEEALLLHAVGDTRLPSKSALMWSDDLGSEETRGRNMAMPAYVGGSIALAGLKWIPSVPSNPARGLPRGVGLIVLTDPETGLPVAVMTGRSWAPGVQAGTQLWALEAVLPSLEQVRVWDIAQERAEAFRERSDRVVPVANAEDACRGADVIVAATMAPESDVPSEWLGPGRPFCSVSSLDPEISFVERADLVVCDLWDHETGHASRPLARALAAGVIARDEVVELPDLVAGRHPGRTTDDQRIFSTPVGLAIEDVAAAARVYRRAMELGIGTELTLWESPIWA